MPVFSKLTIPKEPNNILEWRDHFKDPTKITKYKITELKSLAKHYGIYVSGTKPILIRRITDYFTKNKLAVQLQAHTRRKLTQRDIRRRGAALRKRSLCVNDCDFYTLEPVSEITWSDFFSYTDDAGFVYGFDISSLISMIKTGNTMNPYTRKDLGETVLRDVAYLRKYTTPAEDTLLRILEARQKPLARRVNDVFYELDYLGHYTDVRWLTDLDRDRLIVFNRTLYDFWHYRFELPTETKRNICPYFNPFRDGYENVAMISRDGTNDDVLKNSITFIENLVYSGTSIEFRRLGSFQVLTALTVVSRSARRSLPYLYETVAYI